jgi:hypothetical protein
MRQRLARLWLVAGLLFTATAAAAADHEELILPIGPVYDQADTQFCWAYSTFHALRTYYTAAGAWHDALVPLDSPRGFRSFLTDRFDPDSGDNPAHLVVQLRDENDLPDAAWTDLYPSDVQSRRELAFGGPAAPAGFPTKHLSRTAILAQVVANLRAATPSVFCNPAHCMMIYGAVLDGGRASEFAIADSIGARTYRRSARQVHDDLDLVMTLMP